MNKLFCCGICSTEEDKILQIIESVKNYVDGFVWCVDSNPASDLTAQLLENYADEGKIIRHPWQNAHDWQANEWLHSGVIKPGDWVLMVDSSEIPQPSWIKGLRKNIEELEAQGLSALYASGRPYLFKFDEYLFFHGTPHWGLCGFTGKAAQLSDDDKKKIIINLRDLNPSKH